MLLKIDKCRPDLRDIAECRHADGDRVVTDGSFLLRAEWMKTHPGN
jgi:hypothetical protein